MENEKWVEQSSMRIEIFNLTARFMICMLLLEFFDLDIKWAEQMP